MSDVNNTNEFKGFPEITNVLDIAVEHSKIINNPETENLVSFKDWDELEEAANTLFLDLTPVSPETLFQEISENEMKAIKKDTVSKKEDILGETINKDSLAKSDLDDSQFILILKNQTDDVLQISEKQSIETNLFSEENALHEKKATASEENFPKKGETNLVEVSIDEPFIMTEENLVEEKIIVAEEELSDVVISVKEENQIKEDIILKEKALFEDESIVSPETETINQENISYVDKAVIEDQLLTVDKPHLKGKIQTEVNEIMIIEEEVLPANKSDIEEEVHSESLSNPKQENYLVNESIINNIEGEESEMPSQTFEENAYPPELIKKIREEILTEIAAGIPEKKADDDVDLFREAEELLYSVNPNATVGDHTKQNTNINQTHISEVEAPYEFDFIW